MMATPKSNSNSKSPVDPISGCCCTARTWTLFFCILKSIFLALALVGAVLKFTRTPEDGEGEESRGTLYSDAETEAKMNKFRWLVTLCTAPPLLVLYGVALFGILKEKRILINLYILVLALEQLITIVVLIRIFSSLNSPAAFLLGFSFGVFIFTILPIAFAVEFRKLVAVRQAPPPPPLDSTPRPTSFYSA